MFEKERMLKRLSKTAYILIKILRIMMYVSIGLMLIGLVFFASGGAEWPEAGGGIRVDMSPGNVRLDLDRNRMILWEVELIATVALGSIILLFAEGVFRSIDRQHSPFSAGNVRRLKLSALFVGLTSFVPGTLSAGMGLVLGLSVKLSLNLQLLLVALILLCLAYVFDYGATLQRQDDETL